MGVGRSAEPNAPPPPGPNGAVPIDGEAIIAPALGNSTRAREARSAGTRARLIECSRAAKGNAPRRGGGGQACRREACFGDHLEDYAHAHTHTHQSWKRALSASPRRMPPDDRCKQRVRRNLVKHTLCTTSMETTASRERCMGLDSDWLLCMKRENNPDVPRTRNARARAHDKQIPMVLEHLGRHLPYGARIPTKSDRASPRTPTAHLSGER